MRFSQRIGLREVKTDVDNAGLSRELKNSLWTAVLEVIINGRNTEKQHGVKYSDLSIYYRDLWIYFYKKPIDNLPWSYGDVTERKARSIVREWFFNAEWDQVLDFIEFSSDYHYNFANICNGFLKREFSAYRFVDNKIVEINSKEEIIEIENAINNSDKFNSVKIHLTTALGLMSDRKNPDYRNSIKESISAVESLSKIITNNNKTTLGQALKEIEMRDKSMNRKNYKKA